MKEARYYTKLEEGKVRCDLCPHACELEDWATGLCHVRTNHGGQLFSDNYGQVTALHSDPIEKKPLYHYYPGQEVLSVGSWGCNLDCGWCQNCGIAHPQAQGYAALPQTLPRELVDAARQPGHIGLAYTYNEPMVWHEYMMDTATLAAEAGLKNVVVTNGYVNSRPLADLLEVTHAFNTDLKGFTAEFYRTRTGGNLQPVKNTLLAVARRGLHQEVTYLVVPGLNDQPEVFNKMAEWIAGELGRHTVLHISRYYPARNMHDPPTPVAVMERLWYIACEHLDHVYPGNVKLHPGAANTDCPKCGHLMAERDGYRVTLRHADAQGKCSHCGTQVFVVS
jgi:pyruvate formate lyase activating enzyme